MVGANQVEMWKLENISSEYTSSWNVPEDDMKPQHIIPWIRVKTDVLIAKKSSPNIS